MSEVKSWSGTAASNNSAAPNGFPENMAYSSVNDACRELMAAVVRWHDDMDGELVSTGSSNAYVLTPNVTYSAYEAGMCFLFLANHQNTGAATLNVSALGAKDLRDGQGVAFGSGAIKARQPMLAIYDATNGYFRAIGAGFLRQSGGTVTGTIIIDKTATAETSQLIIISQAGYPSYVTLSIDSITRAQAGVRASDGAYNILVRDAAGANSETALVANHNGSVDLYHNDTAKLSTASHGASVDGFLLETVEFVGPVDAQTTTVGDDTRMVVCTHLATVPSHTIKLPANPTQGQRVRVCNGGYAITSLTVSANLGQTLMSAGPTTLAAGDYFEYIYRLGGEWYRCG